MCYTLKVEFEDFVRRDLVHNIHGIVIYTRPVRKVNLHHV